MDRINIIKTINLIRAKTDFYESLPPSALSFTTLLQRLYRKIIRRKTLFFAWQAKDISFSDFLSSALPFQWRFGRFKNTNKIGLYKYLNKNLEQAIKTSDLNIFPSATFGSVDLIRMVEQIIINDQYHAEKFIKRDSIVIDGGANVGVFSLLAAQLAPMGQIFSFEPVLETHKILVKNTMNYPHITALQMSLGDRSGPSEISVNPRHLSQSFVKTENSNFRFGKIRINDPTFESESVTMTTIDQFVADKKLKRIDFIKLDCEGYERQILEGARRTIKNFGPVIAVSAYHFTSDKEEIPRLIRSVNLKYHYEFSKRSEEDLIFWI
jgi:FkbM family methyltransferase